MMAIQNDATHAVVLTIDFKDGGEPDTEILMFGTFAECDEMARVLPAVAYKGDRPILGASVSVFPLHPVCSDCGSRHETGVCALAPPGR